MKGTIEIYKNYGVLALEKRNVYTYGGEHPHATCSDKINAQIPEGWELCKNMMDQTIVEAPWGQTYMINDVLTGNEIPCFAADTPDGRHIFHALKVIEED